MNITFGTIKKVGRDSSSNEKFPNLPVITVEGIKGEGKSRRILFNSKSMELLNIPAGAQQSVIFGFVELDENNGRKLLVANADALVGKEHTVTYPVSKNKVQFEEPSKEKGKGISSSPLHTEITSFLQIDPNTDNEFILSFFGDEQGMRLYELQNYKEAEDAATELFTPHVPAAMPDPSILSYSNQDDAREASLDNEFEKEVIEDLGEVRHREIEETDADIKEQNANIDPKDIEEEFVSNTTESDEIWN